MHEYILKLNGSSRGIGPEIFIPAWHKSNMWQETPVYRSYSPQPNGSTSRYSKNSQELF